MVHSSDLVVFLETWKSLMVTDDNNVYKINHLRAHCIQHIFFEVYYRTQYG